MMILGITLILICTVLVYWNISYSPFKHSFLHDMKKRASRIDKSNEVCTPEEIAKLPEVLQKYCDYISLENFPKYQIVRTEFKKSKFVFDAQSGKVLDMDYDLWLFYDKPYRSAYCSSSIYGVPFDGVDYCTADQEGGMKGILGKAIQIFDVRDKQGYKAELITWMAESALVNPSALLSPYITYEQIDDSHVKATIHYNGVSGSGIFTFNEDGAIIHFYSDERQVETIKGVKTMVGWRCEYGDQKQNGERCPISTIRCVKVFPEKEVVYFESDHFKVEYIK